MKIMTSPSVLEEFRRVLIIVENLPSRLTAESGRKQPPYEKPGTQSRSSAPPARAMRINMK